MTPPVVTLFLRSSMLVVFLFCSFAEANAQTNQRSDPFDQEVPLELHGVTQALQQNNFDQALKLLADLRKDALKTRNRQLQAEIITSMKEVNRLKREFIKVKKDYETFLKSKDPEAARVISNFYCLEKCDWNSGLQFLTKSDSPELLKTAAADLKRPSSPENQARLADAWWQVAEAEKGKVRKAYLLRGRYWYLLARPSLPAVERVDRDKKLALIPLEADKIVIWNQHNGQYLDRGTEACVVTLLLQGKPVWRKATRIPWDQDAPACQTLNPPAVRFDQIRVDVTQYRGNGGGLGEIEVFDNKINVASNCSVVASEYWEDNPKHHPTNLTNGDNSGATGYWLLNNRKNGWALVDLVNYLPFQ
ncbi:hypothetical protein Pan110_36430 [Gimesia panareensis]|nr:hypothetical protein Pan110_36430 [Gimesia panareensis]